MQPNQQTRVQMYHPKNYGSFYLGVTLVLPIVTSFLGWYKFTMVYSGATDYHGTNVPPQKPWYVGITLVQLYHRRKHGTSYHGFTIVKPWKDLYGFWGGTFVPW
jgi:hypothetical protein